LSYPPASSLNGVPFPATLRADPDKLKAVPQDFIITQAACLLFHIIFQRQIKIIHLPAFLTAHVVMIVGIAIEPFLDATDIEFLNKPFIRENFQIPVDAAETDPGHPFPQQQIQVISARMICQAAQNFQKHLPLFSYAHMRSSLLF
jgi:hypothetical protein